MVNIPIYFYCENQQKNVNVKKCQLFIEERKNNNIPINEKKEICNTCLSKIEKIKQSILNNDIPVCCGKELKNNKCQVCGDDFSNI